MAYATVDDVQARLTRTLDSDERKVCQALLQDAAAIIDAVAMMARYDAKNVVSCRMVMRALGDGETGTVPMGATQGSMSALGYSQSWTVSSGGSVGELYLSKLEKQMLGIGNKIGSYSPTEELATKGIPYGWYGGGCCQ